MLTTWQRGRELVMQPREHEEGPLREFVDELHARTPPLPRVPGTAVFLNRNKITAPLAMRACVKHLHVLHEHVVILSIETLAARTSRRPTGSSTTISATATDAITHAGARFGYMDRPNVPDVLRLLERTPIESALEVDQASYFLSTIDLYRGDAPGMRRRRKDAVPRRRAAQHRRRGLLLAAPRSHRDPGFENRGVALRGRVRPARAPGPRARAELAGRSG